MIRSLSKFCLTYKLPFYGLILYIFSSLASLNISMSSSLFVCWGFGGIALLNILGFLSLVCLWRTHWTCPGIVSADWSSSDFAAGFSISQWSLCKKCNQLVLPARAYHCRKINQCVLRYDHFCPWADQVIGYGNYKYFLLLLTYGVLAVGGVVLGCATDIIYWHSYYEEAAHWTTFVLLLVSLCMGYGLGALWYFHCLLVTVNLTTKEFFLWKESTKGVPVSEFDLGVYNNWKQSLGKNVWNWWCPWIYEQDTDGYSFPNKK